MDSNKKTLEQLQKSITSTEILQKNKTIGLYCIDTSKNRCLFKSKDCKYCYVDKAYKMYTTTLNDSYDMRIDKNWLYLTGTLLKAILDKKQKTIKRIRFVTKGECINNNYDIEKIKDICLKNPDTKFWLPSRAMNNPVLADIIIKELLPIKNLRFYASIDTGTTIEQYNYLKANNVSCMFFGDDNLKDFFGDKMVKCSKTWYKKDDKRYKKCDTCNICFNPNNKIVHLKMH